MHKNWYENPICTIDSALLEIAKARQLQLIKPPRSLGRLEEIGIKLAAIQASQQPSIDYPWISIFVGDHGIATDNNISAFPQIVTTEMLRQLAHGGAAISILSKLWNAKLEVINVGTIKTVNLAGVQDARVGAGTCNFLINSAMTVDQLNNALEVGRSAADRAAYYKSQLFIGGEMGIGNTTSASAITCAILKIPANNIVGPGTGISSNNIKNKIHIVEMGLAKYKSCNPIFILQAMGGFEIAALVGAYIRCGQLGLPILIDGFITTTAALVAFKLQPNILDWLFYSHYSTEPGHRYILEVLGAKPLINLEMCLGEASGAAVALPIMKAAAALHTNMLTFTEAGVSQ